MSAIVFLISLACFPRQLHAAEPPTNTEPGSFFVATNGNDQWSGSSLNVNPGKTDGPFATLPRALQAARDYRKQVGSNVSASVFLRGGLYLLAEPVIVKPEDSNLTLTSYGSETPVLSGGRRITGWRPAVVQGKNVWVAELPDVRNGKWSFHELWVNGQRAVLARYPKRGFLKVAEVPDKTANISVGVRRFKFNPGELKAWPTVTNANVVVMNMWLDGHLPVTGLNEGGQEMNFSKRSHLVLKTGNLYYLEGALDFLEAPGEWCLDHSSGRLYYLPRPGETLKSVEAIAPALTQVIRFEGEPGTAEFVQRVLVRHLTFSHTEWYFPGDSMKAKPMRGSGPDLDPEVDGLDQASAEVPAAVWGQGMRHCMVRDCAFTHIGTYGLELETGCTSNFISRCEFSDLGAGGIKLGPRPVTKTVAELTQHNEVSDCRIHDGGYLFHDGQGVLFFQTANDQLLHNEIYDLWQVGISLGWTWGYGPSLSSNNIIAFNHIHHLGSRTDGEGPILSDLGGIYTVGHQPGTRILNNLIHDIAGSEYGGWGLYFDGGSWDIVAESNIVYRTTHGGFHQHYGATNGVMNNIFAFGRDVQIDRTRPEPLVSFLFMHNIVYFDSGTVVAGNWTRHQYQIDWNIYFDARPGATPQGTRFEGATFAQWQSWGNDAHSIIADPLFIAPRQYDFRLRSDSPAFKIGFQPIDVSQVGIRH